ncbi:MAG TPA: phospholipase D-like domain-containing protein [Pseudomonadales bacterium]
MSWGLALIIAIVVAFAGLLLANFVGGEKKITRDIRRHYGLEEVRFLDELGLLLGPPFVQGNRIRTLLNGDEIFPAMLAAIRGAHTSITFETYIYWAGDIGRDFAESLAERARAGVKVHVLLDWVGSAKMDSTLLTLMTDAGVKVVKFHPPSWSKLGRMNNRTHRKLLIVDGRIGFTGGVGIAPEWTGHAQDPQHWRDSHYQVEGPVVAQMQSVFIDNWVKVTGGVLLGPDYFPTLEPVSSSLAQMFSSSPTGGSESMQLMYLMAVTAASHSIDLSAAYFVPDSLTRDALMAAMERGVKLRIVVPGARIDAKSVRRASRAMWGPLLEAGAVIAEYQPTMYHCKVMIVDGLLVSVGSTNFDNRSFRLNDEATLNVVDRDFAALQTAIFENDLAHAKKMTYAAWRKRPLQEKLIEKMAGLIGTQL